MQDDIPTLERRLTRGADLLWAMEHEGKRDTGEYAAYLRHFEDLLGKYEWACREQERATEERIAA